MAKPHSGRMRANGWTCADYRIQRRARMARPSNPVAASAMLDGSGTGVVSNSMPYQDPVTA
jgi:hypothetical protein